MSVKSNNPMLSLYSRKHLSTKLTVFQSCSSWLSLYWSRRSTFRRRAKLIRPSIGSLLATSNGACAGYNRKQIYYAEQPQTLARHPNKNITTGNFEWMNVGTVLSPQAFSSSSINDTLAAQRWMNDTSGDSSAKTALMTRFLYCFALL